MTNAKAVDYMLLENPDALDDVDELKKIAELVEVDEIHIFDETGCIVSGTHPEYYGYTFDSGEQMEFFKPMLEDKTLSLVQDITPNTAEGKVMQYSAVWSTSGNYIVQIGMSPDSVLSLTEHNEISYIFSLLTTDVGAELYAIDKESKTIIGSTDSDCIDVKMKVLGFDLDRIESSGDGFHAVINGVPSFCIFTEVDGTLVGRVISDTRMYRSIPNAVIALIGGLIIVALVLIIAISRHINKYVIKEINYVNDKLQKIADG
ncbi:MAG: GGDEF domain-containing protein, partial [Ruminococcus sp.]|nr:GGDEF domain-containing protein [Ruminococcus sp.]